MDFHHLKSTVQHITLSEEAKSRIIRNCASSAASQKEENVMKKHTYFKKPATLAAVLALCLCLTLSVAAAGGFGQFQDILGFGGAVVGTAYENATQEIQVEARIEKSQIILTATFVDSDAFPYRELETLTLGEYRILDGEGKFIAQGSGEAPVVIENGQVALTIPLNGMDCTGCELVISSFIGSKKADQPLEITGSWHCGLE